MARPATIEGTKKALITAAYKAANRIRDNDQSETDAKYLDSFLKYMLPSLLSIEDDDEDDIDEFDLSTIIQS